MNSLNFYYNGRHSSEFDVYLVRMESGLITQPFLPKKTINSETVMGNNTPYVFGNSYEPLQYKITLACIDEKWTDEKKRKVAKWLDTSTFEEFYAEDEPDKIYYFQYQGSIDMTHNTLGDGYIEITMQNESPYARSPIQERRYELTTITSPTIIEFDNKGDAEIYPEMWIYMINSGDFQIRNLSNGGKDFKFTGLVNDETIYVDNENHHIETDLTLTYRYDNFNNNYLELVEGINRLEITGACNLMFRYQYYLKG